MAWNLWPGNYPIVIAQELGLFEKHGVTVESILSDSYETMAPDFNAHKTDSSKVNADFLISSGSLNTAPDIERLLDPSFLE